MSKSYYSLGLMSGTSMDGVDASVIKTDGKVEYTAILDKYYQYPKSIFKNLTALRDKIKSSKDIKKYVATPQREWLKGPLFKEVMDLISNGLLVKHKIIKFSNFQRLYNNYHSSKILGNSFFIWKIINLEFFMQNLSN